MSDEQHRQKDEAAETPVERSEVEGAAAEPEGGDTASPDAGAPDAASASGPSAAEGNTDAGREAGADEGQPDAARETGADEEQPAAESPAASIEDELAEARREAGQNLDRALRAQAELENVRKRLERDLQNAHKFALERFVSELLPVRGSLELALAASSDEGAGGVVAGAASIIEGVELALRMLDQAMEKFGVKIVDPDGEPFDPEFHQAMTMQESDTAESGTVLTVVQKGCLLNERLVRPAMVIVAK